MSAPVREELVVLLDEQGNAVGVAPKATVHTASTPLHRAFSCYLFDADGRLLLTRRAHGKVAFPGVWTNSVCGHPAPGEDDVSAIRRRSRQELALEPHGVEVALPSFRYRAESSGIVENEICPVYLARVGGSPVPEPSEVGAFAWSYWPEFVDGVHDDPQRFSPWSRLQAERLDASGAVTSFLTR